MENGSPPPAVPNRHPVQVVVEDDLQRSRLTVFFRLLLAIPHFIWFVLWSIVRVPRLDRQLVRSP